MNADLERRRLLREAHPDRRQLLGRRASDAVPKIDCPRCACSASAVINSRPALRDRGVRRRRECDDCAQRFTTLETIERVN